MSAAGEVALYGHATSIVAHTAFAGYLLTSARSPSHGQRPGDFLVAALLSTAAWSAMALTAETFTARWLAPAAVALDLLRYGLWFAFLLNLLDAGDPGRRPKAIRLLRVGGVTGLLAAALMLTLRVVGDELDVLSRAQIVASLSLAVLGLLMVEQLFRNLGEGSRWNAKPVCLGLAAVFAFDVYLYAEGLLFSRFDDDALSFRGAAHVIAVPLLFVASRRGSNWIARLQVSRSAAFHSLTLVLAGAYLLFMSAIGYYVRYFGGDWGRALQLGLLVVGLSILSMLVYSGSLRAWLRVFVGKHFFSYRYDYREEWLRFTAMLSSERSPREMGEMIVQSLAKLVECPAGSLWLRSGAEQDFVQTVHWNCPLIPEAEAAGSPLCTFLREMGWVVDLEEFRSSPRRYQGLAIPTWLLGVPNGWLVVPLLARDELLAFVVLSRPRTNIKLNWEVLDLLKTAGRQAAGYLAQIQAAEALLEARKFDAFNRMSAFVVHDLKNIVAQLSLMLKNAERLHDNREFQQDMLLTVSSSLEKMRRLMLQLREGATPPGGSHGVELSHIIRRLLALAKSQGRTLDIEEAERLSTRGHEDRLERVLGHLVQNAFDATPHTGRVWLKIERHSGQVKVVVGDTGSGMNEEFVRNQLFRPFNSTKSNGMGIGTYESFQYVRELGGSMAVDSLPGRGTVITVFLPLFEGHRGSDLLRTTAT